MTHVDHKPAHLSASCAVLTVSDTRTVETDESGRLLCERLTGAGHRIEVYEILPDEPGDVRGKVRALV
ncbi:MAG: molybdenum cofactor biosynthesis protein, partial [Myxococcales bacterium]